MQVTETAVGTNTGIGLALPNGGTGIVISGHAHGNAIGGFQPSVEPQVTVSSNAGYGIAIVGKAHDNVVVHTYIGTNYNDTAALGNDLGGILLGPGTSSNAIGGASAALQDKILNSVGGAGVVVRSSSGDAVVGDLISGNAGVGVDISGVATGTSVQADEIDDNAGTGVRLDGARRVVIGGVAPGSGNRIVGNLNFGLYASGNCSGTAVGTNAIAMNAAGDVDLTRSRGIVSIA